MSSNLRIEVASEDDIPDLTSLIIKTFSEYEMEVMLGNVDTPEAIQAAIPRHQRAWREHMDETGQPSAIKCIYTDPSSKEETLAACGQWYIFDKPRSKENAKKWNYLLTAEWLPADGEERAKLMPGFIAMANVRIKWLAGRGHAILQYMATHKDWRRKGAASKCVQWGTDRCKELGIPAYLEASPAGRLVYEKLGFEVVDEIDDGMGTISPAMMWWPPGFTAADKVPLVE